MGAWAPWTKADIDCLEIVQKRAVRAISGLKEASFEEKLREVGKRLTWFRPTKL